MNVSGMFDAVRVARVPVTAVTVSVRATPRVSPMSETAECHDAEAGGTKQETRTVEIHRRKEV